MQTHTVDRNAQNNTFGDMPRIPYKSSRISMGVKKLLEGRKGKKERNHPKR